MESGFGWRLKKKDVKSAVEKTASVELTWNVIVHFGSLIGGVEWSVSVNGPLV